MTQAESMLARIDRAVAAALPRWGCSPAATAHMINHSENVTYRVDDPQAGRTTILRVHRPGYHSEAAIRSELRWLDALRDEADVVTADHAAGAGWCFDPDPGRATSRATP